MTVMEKRLAERLLQKDKELQAVKAGVKELGQAVDAVMIATALDYGARLPDGGMVLTMDRPAVTLNSKYTVKTKIDKRGRIRVEVREKA